MSVAGMASIVGLGRRGLAGLCIGLAAAGAAVSAEDDDFLIATGGDLADLCGVAPDSPRASAAVHMCHGYIIGVHHLHTAYSQGDGAIYCVPEQGTPTRNEVATEFAAWVAATPDVADLPAVEALVRWAADRFPCS